ncbi:hypothetical protein BH23CHL8_BH23CHL8_28420 [soil metagenome]
MALVGAPEGREAIVRVKSLGVLITASFLTLGACAEATPTVAPPAASPIVDDASSVDASPSELPGVIPGESIPAEDDTAEDPLATEAG